MTNLEFLKVHTWIKEQFHDQIIIELTLREIADMAEEHLELDDVTTNAVASILKDLGKQTARAAASKSPLNALRKEVDELRASLDALTNIVKEMNQ